MDDKDVASEEALKLYEKVRKISSEDVSLVTVRDHSQNTLNLAITTKNEVVEMKMNLENIPIPDMIHLHKKTRDIIYTDMLKATLKLSRLQSSKRKIENQLRQEKVQNRAHQVQIKNLQTYLLVAETQEDEGSGIQKLLNEKENVIQLLKKKLNISSTQLIQASKLIELEKEK